MFYAVYGDEFRRNNGVGIYHVGNGTQMGRSVPQNGFSCHHAIGVETDKGIVAGHLSRLAEVGYTLEMFGQNLPGLHLGIRELLVLPGDFGQLIS